MSSLRKLSIETIHSRYKIPKSIHIQYCTDESTFPQSSEKEFQICVTLGQIHSGLRLPIKKNSLLFDFLILLQRSPGQFNGNFYRIFRSLHRMNRRNRRLRDALKKEKLEKNQPYTKEDDSQHPVWTCQHVLDAYDLQSVSDSENLFWYLRKKSKGLPLPIEIVIDNADKNWRKFPLLISGNWYDDGTDATPSKGRKIEWLWRANKEGGKPSFYDLSLLSSAKVFKDPNSMDASRIQKGRVSKASASSLTKSSEQRDVSHGTGELPACPPPDPETSSSPVLVEHKSLSSQNGPLLNSVALDLSDELQAEFNPNDSLAPNNSSLFPASQSVTKRKGSDSDAMVSKRRKDAHPSESKGVEDVPPDPFGDDTPLDTSVRGDNNVDAPQGPNKAAIPDLNVDHAPLSPILSSMSGIQSVDVAAAIMQNISLPTDGEAYVLDSYHDVANGLYLVNAVCQGNANYVKKLQAELNEVKKDKEVLNEEVAKLQSLVRSLELAVSRLQSENDAYKSSVTSLQIDIDRFSQQNARLQEDVTKSTNAYALLVKEKDALHSSHDELLEKQDALLDSYKTLKKELVHLKSDFKRDKLAMESKHKKEMDDTSECYAKRIQENEAAHVHALNMQRTKLETDCRRLVREGAQKVAKMILSKSPEELKSLAEKLKSKGNTEDPSEG